MDINSFSASGKLLLFGEYLVLRDSLSLAIPLSYGQTLELNSSTNPGIYWVSKEQGKKWLSIQFSEDLEILKSNDHEKAIIVQKLLQFIKKGNPKATTKGVQIVFNTDFDRNFGFGTSSTFISLLSQWSGINPYQLLEESFGGSGYDIAAATAQKPFVYNRQEKITQYIDLPKSITDNLLFIYLGSKQSSAQEIAKFKDLETSPTQIEQMNKIVEASISCKTMEEWESLMEESETLLSGILQTKPVKELLFADYPYAVKSLGAWGGDFVMASCRDIEESRRYFIDKNFDQAIFTFNELIK